LFQLQCLLNPRHRALFDTNEAAAPSLGIIRSKALLSPDVDLHGTTLYGTTLHTPAPMSAPDTRRMHARDGLSAPAAQPMPVPHPFPPCHSLPAKGFGRAAYASLTSPRAYAHHGVGGPHTMPPMTPKIAMAGTKGAARAGTVPLVRLSVPLGANIGALSAIISTLSAIISTLSAVISTP
jgi:hypothetical protein